MSSLAGAPFDASSWQPRPAKNPSPTREGSGARAEKIEKAIPESLADYVVYVKGADFWSTNLERVRASHPLQRRSLTPARQIASETGLFGFWSGFVGHLPLWANLAGSKWLFPPAARFAVPLGVGALLKSQLVGMGCLIGLMPLGYVLGHFVLPPVSRHLAHCSGRFRAALTISDRMRPFLPTEEFAPLKQAANRAVWPAIVASSACAFVVSAAVAAGISIQIAFCAAAVSTSAAVAVVAIDATVVCLGLCLLRYIFKDSDTLKTVKQEYNAAWSEGFHSYLDDLDGVMRGRGWT